MDTQLATWLSIVVVGVIAFLSAGLGLLLYRFSSAAVEHRGIRLTGATAIAWLFFLGTSKFYLGVSADMHLRLQADRDIIQDAVRQTAEEVADHARRYRECALHIGEFECKAPADRLVNSCDMLVSQVQ